MTTQHRHLFARVLSLALLTLLATAAQAQRIHAYLAAGPTVSQVEGDELKGFRKWGGTGGVGALVSLSENNRWKMCVEVDFAQRGFKNKTRNPYNIDATLNYVDIPVTFHFHDNKGGMTFGAGLLYGRLVKQPHGKLDHTSTFLPDTNDMTFLKNDFAAIIDLRFTVWRGLQLNLRFQYSIAPIKKDWKFVEYENETQIRNDDPAVWYNNCRNISIGARLIWEFGTEDKSSSSRKTRRHRR